jgi:hypothetical protein
MGGIPRFAEQSTLYKIQWEGVSEYHLIDSFPGRMPWSMSPHTGNNVTDQKVMAYAQCVARNTKQLIIDI